jgi:hypothetical protein
MAQRYVEVYRKLLDRRSAGDALLQGQILGREPFKGPQLAS